MNKVLLIIFIFTGLLTHAQQSYKITGVIKDQNKKVIGGVTVNLVPNKDTLPIGTTQTDQSGMYHFEKVPSGTYNIQATFIGLKSVVSSSFQLKGKLITIMGDLVMAPENQLLKTVTVVAANKTIESKDGKLVYNIDKSISASGSNAFDMVRRTPGITVDADENISLKGSAGVNIMVDGKMTYMTSGQLTTYLKSLPAENLNRIEVITTPSSEYDAAGNAGVINIVTKKMNKEGYALNFTGNGGAGRYVQTTDGLVGNIRTKTFNFFGSYTYNYNKSQPHELSHDQQCGNTD